MSFKDKVINRIEENKKITAKKASYKFIQEYTSYLEETYKQKALYYFLNNISKDEFISNSKKEIKNDTTLYANEKRRQLLNSIGA